MIELSLLETKYDTLSEALAAGAQALCPGERLVVAADNASALKFLTGAKKDESGTYVYPDEIESAGKAAGLCLERVYYPLPCARTAVTFYTDEFPPSPSCFRGISESTTESRYIFADEEALYGALSRAGAFAPLAPSFVIVYRSRESEPSSLPIYAKYNQTRKARYQIKTEIFERDGQRKVIKTALVPEADAHIAGFDKKAEILESEDSELIPLRGEQGLDENGRRSVTFPYIEGESLDDVLSRGIRDGLADEEALSRATELISHGVRHGLDSLFENIIVRGGEYILIDYEWVSSEPADSSFIAYRALKYWYQGHREGLYAYSGEADFIGRLGITDIPGYEAMEEELQHQVRGRALDIERLHTLPQTYAYSAQAHDEIAHSLETIDTLRGEVSGLRKTLSKERETERLSQNHIKNIEHICEVQRGTIEELRREREYLARHESLISRLVRYLIGRLDEWAPAGSRRRTYIHLMRHPLRTLRLLMSSRGRLFIRGLLEIGEDFDFLSFPVTDHPLVSVVIPVYNEAGYTYRCLRSILEHTDFDATPLEIIIADDSSTDATAHLGDYAEGVVITRSLTNQGFLLNANRGAALSRGDYIFFLNNDTLVHEGWLSSLVSRMEQDPGTGLTGSKLIYPDGRLQEAGGIIWSDGSGWNYGRGDDPAEPEYCYAREVDYISGAAILIRRFLWEEIGGFDERYVPAYSEDSDLAFEVRRRGYKVVYEPGSVITHFEGMSCGRDVEDTHALKHYQLLNQEKFRTKWATELAGQEDNTGSPDPFNARERGRGIPLVVIVDHYVPTWDKDAGSLTTYQYIRLFLSHGCRVKLIGDNFLHEEPYTSSLEELGVEVLYGDRMREGIHEWLRAHARDITCCILNRPHIAVKYIDLLQELGVRTVYYGHDLHFMRLMREYELTGEIETLSEAERMKTMELGVIEQADRVWYPSEEEIREIKKLRPGAHARAIPGYIWDEPGQARDREELAGSRDILFVGGFRHTPNIDALEWLVGEVWPKVREACPEARLLVVGSGATDEILSLHDPSRGIEILGFVRDARLKELYRSTRLSVVPLRYGAGVKGKTVEALYYSAPVVSTPVGAEGIPDAADVMIVAPAEAEALAEALISAYRDTDRLFDMSRRLPRYIREHFSSEHAWEIIKEDLTKE